MAWFGDGLSSLSNLKGQITNFTKEVLSEGIVEEIDERSRQFEETNEKCIQLQELLNSKDAEIALLRRQNCELQKAVVELNAHPHESIKTNTYRLYIVSWINKGLVDGESEATNVTVLYIVLKMVRHKKAHKTQSLARCLFRFLATSYVYIVAQMVSSEQFT
ncbi:hypothetical protein PV326_011991 [Microctonus aethiopoides]|nr:hypothetical protein PV326_011991 [Microctonus aethiopoides]